VTGRTTQGRETRLTALSPGLCHAIQLFARPVRRVNGQMPDRRARLRMVHDASTARATARCRAIGCELPRQGELGFCAACEAVYRASVELRERLLEAHGARIAAAHPELFSSLDPERRAALLGHLAAHVREAGSPHMGALDPAGLEDFLRELEENGDDA
jgi:hypothetical protein